MNTLNTFDKKNFIGKGTTRKVYRCDDQNFIVKELIDGCSYNPNIIEWYVYKYANKSKYGSKVYNFLNPCIEISNDSKYLIMPYCELNTKPISSNIFGSQVDYFWDWKKRNNWGHYNKELRLIDYGFSGNINVIKDIDIFSEILIEIENKKRSS